MGTVKDPRESENEDQDDLQESSEQDEGTSAQSKPEEPRYQITDWASF